MDDDRKSDKKFFLVKEGSSSPRNMISMDQVKSLYIASGMSAEEIADQTFLPIQKVKDIIEKNKLPELRKAYVREGLSKIQNEQVNQAQKLMDLELNFKKFRIKQLEAMLEDYAAYFARYGDFYKRHPTTGDILKDQNGIPMHIKLPNVTREIMQLKESVTLSEGLKNVLNQIDAILNADNRERVETNDDTIDAEYTSLFDPSE